MISDECVKVLKVEAWYRTLTKYVCKMMKIYTLSGKVQGEREKSFKNN